MQFLLRPAAVFQLLIMAAPLLALILKSCRILLLSVMGILWAFVDQTMVITELVHSLDAFQANGIGSLLWARPGSQGEASRPGSWLFPDAGQGVLV